jgi:uncharacterized repeat protein (TIGR01451 family)
MKSLNPRLLLKYLTSNALRPTPRRKANRSILLSQVIRALSSLVFVGLFVEMNTAEAVPFTFGTGPQQADWPPNSLSQTYSNVVSGVTLRFNYSISGGSFNTNVPRLAGPGTTTANFTGGIASNSLFTTYNFTAVPQIANLTIDFVNAAGDRVPVDNLSHTIIDIDRSCNRDWQDVVSTRGVLINNSSDPATPPPNTVDAQPSTVGTPVTPSIVGAQSNLRGSTAANATVQDITPLVGGASSPAAYTPSAGSLTFRGLTFGRDAGDAGASVRLDPLVDGVTTGANCTVPPDSNNRGAEAANTSAEGNVAFSTPSSITRLEFQFGNGPTDSVANGLGFVLPSDPGPHGVGVLADFNFDPGIIGIAKAATPATPDPARPGNFLTTFTFLIRNLGTVPLNTVQVIDNLATTFPAGFVIQTPPAITATTLGAAVAPNPTFGSGGNTSLLAGGPGSLLPVNSSATITTTVSFNPGNALTFNNQAIATGFTPGGGLTRDRSNNGPDIVTQPGTQDPTGPNGPDTPTPIAIVSVRPEIGVTKQVTDIVDNGNGSFRVTYRQIVRNLSSTAIALNNVRLVDQPLNSVYRVGSSNGAVSSTYVPNSLRIGPNLGPAGYRGNPVINTAGFNGTDSGGTGLELLQTTGNTLAQGEYFVVDYDVTVVPGENLGDGPNDPPYDGQVRAVGSNATITVTDLSDDVTNFPLEPLTPLEQLPRDLTGNGTATDSVDGQGNPIPGLAGDSNSNNTPTPNENDPTPVIFNRLTVLIFKSITQVGNQAITAPLPPQVPGAPAGSVGVINVPSANPAVSEPAIGELFNYTLYFRNLSTTQSVFNFEICDNLPPEVEFVSFVSANGTFLRELTDVPRPNGQGRSCTDLVTGTQLTQTGSSGAVLFNLGTLTPEQTGSVTFTMRRIR